MDNTDKVQLFLNRPALERLIGGDTEVEVKLREQVVAEFVKKHLKQFQTDKLIGPALEKYKQALANEVKLAVGEEYWADGYLQPRLRDRVKLLIDAAIKIAIEDKVRTWLHDRAEQYAKEFDEAVQRYQGRMLQLAERTARETLEKVERQAERHFDAYFERRVQEEAARRIALAATIQDGVDRPAPRSSPPAEPAQKAAYPTITTTA